MVEKGKARFDQDRLLVVTPGVTTERTDTEAADNDTVLSLTTLWHTKEETRLQ